MTADLPATPPANEALRQELISQVMRYENTDADIIADDILHFIKSHAEQEKAAAEKQARIDELERLDGLAYGQDYYNYQQKRLAELRGGGGKA